MRRRAFVCGSVAMLAPPRVAEAQASERVATIGILFGSAPASAVVGLEPRSPYLRAFIHGLRDKGYAVGRNVLIETRSAEGQAERLSALAAELVSLRVDVMLADIGRPIIAARNAAYSTPIVMVGALDPVGNGLVASLSRPGGNITGLSWDVTPEQAAKWSHTH